MNFKPTILKVLISVLIPLIITSIFLINMNTSNDAYLCAKGACGREEVGVCCFVPCTASEYYKSCYIYTTIVIELILLFILIYALLSVLDNKKLKT